MLAAQEGVREVAVVGLADRTWGEIVTAVLVPDEGVELDLGVLGASCEELLASYKRPRRWVVLDALPRNAYGKVLKRESASRWPEPG